VNVEVAADSLLAASRHLSEKFSIKIELRICRWSETTVLDLVRILPGYRQSALGAQFDTFAGTSAATVNTTRDGISVTDGRFINGVFSTPPSIRIWSVRYA
jgi:hypothetical protein